MIFFADKNNPNYIASKEFRETSPAVIEASDEERLAYVTNFIEEFYREFGGYPNSLLIENLANLLLRPYIGSKEEEYKILSSYSLDRREQKQVNYLDEVQYTVGQDIGQGRSQKSREAKRKEGSS